MNVEIFLFRDNVIRRIQEHSVGAGIVNVLDLKRRMRGHALLKKFKEIRVSNDSEQEKLHKIEEEFMTSHFYMRSTPAELSTVTLSSNVTSDLQHLNNHIIVTGKGLSNLYDLIRPLRAKDMGPMRYIVILYPYDLPHTVWKHIAMFEGVLFVKGSPVEEADIRRAGIFRAQHVVILADSSADRISSTVGGAAGVEALVDADAIFAYKAMKRLNDKAHVVVEIVRHGNVAYLSPTDNDAAVWSSTDYRFSPPFASGALFTSSLLDTIVCQSFYNPQIIAVVNKLISGKDQKEVNAAANQAGNASFSGLATLKLKGLDAVVASSLYQVPVPAGYAGKQYGEIFRHFSAQGIICLAVYRGLAGNTNRLNTMSYVFTNPEDTVEVLECDKIFVLSPKPLLATSTLKVLIDYALFID